LQVVKTFRYVIGSWYFDYFITS